MESWLETKKKYLIDAIIHAYPTKADLEKVVYCELSENLDAIAGGENLTDIVFKLVTKWAIPRGKLKLLFQICYKERPDNRKFKEIEKQYETHTRREQLINILQPYWEAEENTILAAYESSLYQVRKLNKTKPQKVEEIINELDMPIQGNYSYIDKFVGYLSLKETKTSLSKDLTIWGQKNIKEFNKLRQELKEEQKQREQQCHPCLMIAISESGDNYFVESWLIKNSDEYHRESFPDCEKLQIDNQGENSANNNLENIPQLVRRLIYKSSVNIKQIHIFLPLKLMNYAVDCWTTYEDEDETIGERYEVFIRCLEGLRGKNPRLLAWRNKGKLLKDKLEEPAANIFTLGDSREIKTLERILKQTNAIAAKIIPVFQNKLPGEILWKAAVPLALWVRQELPDIDNRVILDDLIKDYCLKNLPEQVKLKRLDAMDNQPPENHVGRHLCLLWDDPDLLPPEQLLTENKL